MSKLPKIIRLKNDEIWCGASELKVKRIVTW